MAYYQPIALIGKARSGKDTIGRRLQQRYAYTPVAFADPLKAMALKANPIIDEVSADADFAYPRLACFVKTYGWERTKDTFPEVRRFLQSLGDAVRAEDEYFFVRLAAEKIRVANEWNLPVVVTDCRYRNEVEELVNLGFKTVQVMRPDGVATGSHSSETELRSYVADNVVWNSRSITSLHAQVDKLVAPMVRR